MSYEQIVYDVDDGILTITLSRPDKLNAFTGQMKNELLSAFDAADNDDEVRVVIVTGSGRGFCAGADLSGGGRTFDYRAARGEERPRRDEPVRDGGGELTLRIFEATKPVIAAINGPAVGVGLTMTLPMDIRLASTEAKLGFPFTRRGIAPDGCSSWFLPRVVGIDTALGWVLSGRVFPAEEALELGLVSKLYGRDDLLPAARAIAADIRDHTSAVSVAAARRLMWRGLAATHPMEVHQVESRLIFDLGREPDAHEGVTSFLEKRPPRFTMRVTTDLPPAARWDEPEFS